MLDLRVAQRLGLLPAQADIAGALEVAAHRALADPDRGRDFTMAQLAFVLETENFADLSHAVAFHDRAASHTRLLRARV
jgi:hypothetical protein